MKIPVNIKITKKFITEQRRVRACDNAESEEFVSEFEGTMTLNGRDIVLGYNDHDDVRIEDTFRDGKCRFLTICSGRQVMVSLAFEEGKSFICYLPTNERADFARIETKKLDIDLGEDGGTVHIIYVSEVPENGAERYDVTISVAPAGKFLRS
ncbi:MAG: DUF1934 family protein [Clostridia bacterium]|nr:DUF1934 family protein [Clostridia bacterium]